MVRTNENDVSQTVSNLVFKRPNRMEIITKKRANLSWNNVGLKGSEEEEKFTFLQEALNSKSQWLPLYEIATMN